MATDFMQSKSGFGNFPKPLYFVCDINLQHNILCILLAHAFLNCNCNGNGCAYHGVVAQRKTAIFIVLIRLKNTHF